MDLIQFMKLHISNLNFISDKIEICSIYWVVAVRGEYKDLTCNIMFIQVPALHYDKIVQDNFFLLYRTKMCDFTYNMALHEILRN